VARPYPVGYDVINYYIPVIANFQEHWEIVSQQFPLYVLILHTFQMVTDLEPQALVIAFAIILYGIFSVSVFSISRKLLGLNELYSLYLTLFVIFQLPVLRTAWDLHKDIFSLALLLIALSLLCPARAKIAGYSIIASSIVASIAVSLDKMVGALFVASFMTYTLAFRARYATYLFLFLVVAVVFAITISSDYGSLQQFPQISASEAFSNASDINSEGYDPKNLLILLVLVNGFLLIPGGFGFMVSNNPLLKIAIAITVMGSFSWLIFPDIQSFAADRWIFLFGIFLSIFAGYGIIRYSQSKIGSNYRTLVLCLVLGISVILGLLYETMPYQFGLVFEKVLGQSIEPFGPATMQFNSISIEDNGGLLKTISWINENTPKNATLMGDKHWRGWMEIKLQHSRTYVFFSSQLAALHYIQNCETEYCYLLIRSSDLLGPMTGKEPIDQVYKSKMFKIFKIGGPKN
jgi:hypothetical protein